MRRRRDFKFAPLREFHGLHVLVRAIPVGISEDIVDLFEALLLQNVELPAATVKL